MPAKFKLKNILVSLIRYISSYHEYQNIFDFEFIFYRDLLIPDDNGRISFYTSRNGALEDQTGSDETILVGGLTENAPEDNVGPVINLFMNDENFVSGGITNEQPTLIAKLQDENGINTASGIGHDIIAIIDGDETNPCVIVNAHTIFSGMITDTTWV